MQLMISTEQPLEEKELLLRAIRPANKKPDFWKGNRLSSAAFKDPKGLSVSRVFDRPLSEAVGWMKSNFQGPIFSVTVLNCLNVHAHLVNKPSPFVPYHYEIHGGENTVVLSDEQALYLARAAKNAEEISL